MDNLGRFRRACDRVWGKWHRNIGKHNYRPSEREPSEFFSINTGPEKGHALYYFVNGKLIQRTDDGKDTVIPPPQEPAPMKWPEPGNPHFYWDSNGNLIRAPRAQEPVPMPSSNDRNTYFKLFQSKKNKCWYFAIYGGNHKRIAQSEGYKRKASAERTIETLKRELANATVKE